MSIGRIPGYIPGMGTGAIAPNPYASGQAYAQEIAGGIDPSQLIAPGVSYSPDQPGGYTQADLNASAGLGPTTPIPVPPPIPPVVPPTPPTITPPIAPPAIPPGYSLPPDISIPPGILQLDMPIIPEGMRELIEGIDMRNIEDILSGLEQPKEMPTVDLSGIEQRLSALETMPQPERISIENVRQGLLADMPTFTPRTDEEILGLMGGVQQPQIPDVSQFATQADIQQAIAGMPQQPVFDPTGIQTQIEQIRSGMSDIPQTFDPSGLQARLDALEARPVYDPTQYASLRPQRTYIDDQPLPLGLL